VAWVTDPFFEEACVLFAQRHSRELPESRYHPPVVTGTLVLSLFVLDSGSDHARLERAQCAADFIARARLRVDIDKVAEMLRFFCILEQSAKEEAEKAEKAAAEAVAEAERKTERKTEAALMLAFRRANELQLLQPLMDTGSVGLLQPRETLVAAIKWFDDQHIFDVPELVRRTACNPRALPFSV
jgi:hypothetical protein